MKLQNPKKVLLSFVFLTMCSLTKNFQYTRFREQPKAQTQKQKKNMLVWWKI